MSNATYAKGQIRPGKFDSKLERDYADRLEILKAAGEIKEWWLKPMRLRISDTPEAKGKKALYYSPDFGVLANDGTYELHETKGHMRNAAWNRLRVSATEHPFKFVLVTKVRGAWTFETI